MIENLLLCVCPAHQGIGRFRNLKFDNRSTKPQVQRRISDRRKGATLVEFAIVSFLLFAVIFGAFEMDRMILVYTSMANSARAGVRYAVVHGYYRDGAVNATTTTNIEKTVKVFASMGILDPSKATITVLYEDGTNNVGSPVSVSIAYAYDPFTSFFPLNVTLSSTAKTPSSSTETSFADAAASRQTMLSGSGQPAELRSIRNTALGDPTAA